MNEMHVDLGVNTDGQYVVQLIVPDREVSLNAAALSSLMADLATASSLILGSDQRDVARRIVPQMTVVDNTSTPDVPSTPLPAHTMGLRWHRKAPGSSHYVTETEQGHKGEAFLGENGWVAVLDGKPLSDVVSKKSHAQRLVLNKLSELA